MVDVTKNASTRAVRGAEHVHMEAVGSYQPDKQPWLYVVPLISKYLKAGGV